MPFLLRRTDEPLASVSCKKSHVLRAKVPPAKCDGAKAGQRRWRTDSTASSGTSRSRFKPSTTCLIASAFATSLCAKRRWLLADLRALTRRSFGGAAVSPCEDATIAAVMSRRRSKGRGVGSVPAHLLRAREPEGFLQTADGQHRLCPLRPEDRAVPEPRARRGRPRDRGTCAAQPCNGGVDWSGLRHGAGTERGTHCASGPCSSCRG